MFSKVLTIIPLLLLITTTAKAEPKPQPLVEFSAVVFEVKQPISEMNLKQENLEIDSESKSKDNNYYFYNEGTITIDKQNKSLNPKRIHVPEHKEHIQLSNLFKHYTQHPQTVELTSNPTILVQNGKEFKIASGMTEKGVTERNMSDGLAGLGIEGSPEYKENGTIVIHDFTVHVQYVNDSKLLNRPLVQSSIKIQPQKQYRLLIPIEKVGAYVMEFIFKIRE